MKNEKPYLARDEIASELHDNITLLNLTYDVCPPDLISCVVTDMGMLPCTSVPVVLRLKNRDLTKLGKGSDNQGDNQENDWFFFYFKVTRLSSNEVLFILIKV